MPKVIIRKTQQNQKGMVTVSQRVIREQNERMIDMQNTIIDLQSIIVRYEMILKAHGINPRTGKKVRR